MFPEQYFTLVAGAQKSPKTPYKVIEVDPSQIILYDFKSLSQQIRNLSVDESGDKVNWPVLNEKSVKRSKPFQLYIK